MTWTNLGMFDAGALTTVEDIPPPYDYLHTLQTRYPVLPRQLPHNAIIVDWSPPVDTATLQPVYLPIWEYLLANTPLDSSPTVTVQVSPGTFSAPATIPISASAMDAEGSVTSVDFYCGTTLLGTDTVSPYTCVWTEVGIGVYRLFARATDNAGLFADSMPGDLVWDCRVDVSAGGSPYTVVWFPDDGEQPIAAGMYFVHVEGGGIDLRTNIAVLR